MTASTKDTHLGFTRRRRRRTSFRRRLFAFNIHVKLVRIVFKFDVSCRPFSANLLLLLFSRCPVPSRPGLCHTHVDEEHPNRTHTKDQPTKRPTDRPTARTKPGRTLSWLCSPIPPHAHVNLDHFYVCSGATLAGTSTIICHSPTMFGLWGHRI